MSDSIYVHIPFCETKCPYCDFNSFAVEGRDVDGYIDALVREFESRGVPSDPPTVFVGGGTPTVIEPDQIDRYLTALTRHFAKNPAREFTVEANPGSLTPAKVAVLKRHGVNRMSIGAQAFQEKHLRRLGRVHEVRDTEDAWRMAHEGGIENVNLDFIFAVPGMVFGEWVDTLARAVDLGAEHLSCYALIFEPGTEFFARRSAGRMTATPERLELAMFRYTERALRLAGLDRYEVSNYARPGLECQHNLRYWRNESYAGFGAGAFSYQDGERFGNERNLARYADRVRATGDAVNTRERLQANDAAAETIVLGLRTAKGVSLPEVAERFDVDLQGLFGETIANLQRGGFLMGQPEGPAADLRLTRRGWRVADAVMGEFLGSPRDLQ
ncbi:MAG: radical SAM family heme chaperone HemW [Planctomycetota bacterium]